MRQVRDSAAAEVRQAREDADRDISATRDDAARQVTEAEARAWQAEQDTAEAYQVEVLAITRAEQAQASAAEETARIRADHQRTLDQLTAAINARIKAVEETRDALRIRAERAESDLDAARTEIHRLAEKLSQASDAGADKEPAEPTSARPRTTSRAKKTAAPRAPRTPA